MDRKWVDHPEHTWLPCVVKDKGGDQATLVSDDEENIKVPAKKFATLASVDEMQLKGVDDVCTLPVVTEGALLHTMRVRYKKQLIYTRVSRILISLNPFQTLKIYEHATLIQYAAASDSMDLPPHIFAIGADALNGLRQGSKDQAVVISGESGAGKTESAKLIMSFVTALEKRRKSFIAGASAGGLEEKVLKTNPVLEAFGNARTVRNNNSSRFGKWLDMQFASDLSLLGCHVTHYLLEVTRVCGQADGERSFHIFFQLINARSSPELKELEVQPCSHYKYLENSAKEAPGIDDKECYDESRDAFSTLGFTAADQLDVFRIVAACLTLGNVTFTEIQNDGAEIQDKSVIETIARHLMVDHAALTKSLLIRKFTIGTDTSEVPLKPEQAISVRDTLAKQLYGLLFAYLIDKINVNLQVAKSGKKATRLLGVLDIAGFESFEKNSLEQLCINLSNEHLQQHFNSYIFKSELEDCKKEGIELTDIEFQDNAECLALIDGKGGVMDLLDEECTIPKGTDQSYVNKVLKAQEKHARLVKPKLAGGKPVYGISHYAGVVNYTCDGWLEKNQNKPPDEALEVLLTSSSSLVKSLAEMMKDMTAEKAAAPGGKKKKESGTSKFRLSLKSLIEKINKADPHYIRCIKPNKEKQPGTFTAPMVMEQLLLSGSLEAVRIRQQGYAIRLPFKAFVLKYRCLGKIHTKKIDHNDKDSKDLVAQVCGAYQKEGVLQKNFAFGSTKVFIRGAQTISTLDNFRERVLGKAVVKIQKVFRGMFMAKKVFASLKSWLQTNCPLAMKPPISSSCLQTLGDLKVAGEKIDELSPILKKAKALPFPFKKAECVTWAEEAMKRIGDEMEATKQMTELLNGSSTDPVSLGKSLARANDLGLSFHESYSMLADRIDKLKVQKPLIEAMKKVVDKGDNAALQDIVAKVKDAGLESGGWLPEFDGANLCRQVSEKLKGSLHAESTVASSQKAPEKEQKVIAPRSSEASCEPSASVGTPLRASNSLETDDGTTSEPLQEAARSERSEPSTPARSEASTKTRKTEKLPKRETEEATPKRKCQTEGGKKSARDSQQTKDEPDMSLRVQWMWGDANVFTRAIARKNPLRWSEWKTVTCTVTEFRSFAPEQGRRPLDVQVQQVNHGSDKSTTLSSEHFRNAAEAIPRLIVVESEHNRDKVKEISERDFLEAKQLLGTSDDETLKELTKNCQILEVIDLGATQVTDNAVQELATNCKNLDLISLGETQVTDKAVQEIASNCPNLRTIILIQTRVTVVGVKELLENCPKLTYINLPKPASKYPQLKTWRSKYPKVSFS